MQISLEKPVEGAPWSPKIPCVVSRQDATSTTPRTESLGYCVFAGEKKLACWRADKGWVEENFVESPATRIKGWLEMIEKVMGDATAASSEDSCGSIVLWKAAADGFAVVEKITSSEAVVWNPSIKELYESVKQKTLEISRLFENDERNPTTGRLIAHEALDQRREEMANLKEGTHVTHSLMKKESGKTIDIIPNVDLGKISSVATAIYAGLKFIGGVAFAKAVLIIVAVYVVVRVFEEILKIGKGWFGG
jgi:hypothetical protein